MGNLSGENRALLARLHVVLEHEAIVVVIQVIATKTEPALISNLAYGLPFMPLLSTAEPFHDKSQKRGITFARHSREGVRGPV